MAKVVEGAALLAAGVAGWALTLPGPWDALWYSLIATGASMTVEGAVQALSGATNAFSIRQAAAPWQIIYGQTRVSGTIVYCSTSGSKKQELNLVIVWAGHPCTSIDTIWIDGRRVYLDGKTTSGAPLTDPDNIVLDMQGNPTAGSATGGNHQDFNGNQYNFGSGGNAGVCCYNHLGNTLSVNPFANLLTPNDANWDSSCWLNGRTASYIKLTYDAASFIGGAPPNIQATVRGKSVYDPRTATTAYSQNMALCIADVLCDQDYGLGCDMSVEIDQAQLISAANSCDEQVALAAGGTEARYQCNGVCSSTFAPGDVINSMLTSCAGRRTYTGGVHGIFVGVWQGSSGLSFGPGNMLGDVQWSPQRKYRDLINRVSGTFICPIYPFAVGYSYDYQDALDTVFNGMFKPTSFPYYAEDVLHGYPEDAYLIADGNKELWQDTHLQWVQSVACAQRIAKIALLRNRYQGTATIPMDLTAYQCVAQDVIELSFPAIAWVNKEVEVNNISFTPKSDPARPGDAPALTTTLSVNEADSSMYDWSTSEELTIDVSASPTMDDAFQVAPPSNLTLESGPTTATVNTDGVTIPRILCIWGSPADQFVLTGGQLEIWWQIAGSSNWMSSGLLSGMLEGYYIGPCVSGAVYNVQIRSIRSGGSYSPWVEVAGYTCETQVSTIDSLNVIYSGGATVASLQPAEPGSDVTDLQSIAHTGTNQGLVNNPTFGFGLQGWSTGQDGVDLVFAQTAPYIIVDSPAAGQYGCFSSSAFQMQVGQTYRIYWTANGSTASDLHHVFLRIYYGTIYNQTISQGAAGYAGYEDLLFGLTGTEAQYYADFVAPADCAWASLCMYYYAGQATQIAVYQVDCVSYGATSAWGADVTANSGNILLQNPNYASGNVGWECQSGWVIQNGTGPLGLGYVAAFTGTTAAITNNQLPALGPGANIIASCFVLGTGNGTIAPRVNFYDISGSLLETVNATFTAPTAFWVQLTVSAVAPANTAYCTIDAAGLGRTTGTIYVSAWTAAILPNSLGQVPDGDGRYAAVETGADNTRNHVLTTPITYEVTYPDSGLTEVPYMSWEVTSNDSSDVFNVSGAVMWSAAVGADIQILGIVDGEYSSAFGYGLGFALTTGYQVCPFFGSATGLAAGTHNITLYYWSPNGSTITMPVGYSQFAQLQQISS